MTKSCFQEDILSFLGQVSFLRHNRELENMERINILCLLGPLAEKEHILPYLVDSNRPLGIDRIQEDVERVVGETSCILFLSVGDCAENKKRQQLEQIKHLMRGLATWNYAAMDAIVRKQSFSLIYRFLLYFRHRLSETAHAVIIYSPLDNTNTVIQRTIQIALKEGIPLLVLDDNCKKLESRIEQLCLEMKRFLIQRLVFEHPFIRYLHPFLGQNLFVFFIQLVVMGIYYWWKAHSIGYKDGLEDGNWEWNYRLISGDRDDLPCQDEELWQFCYGTVGFDTFHSQGMSNLLGSLNSLPFLGMNEIVLYKKYIRLLLMDGYSYLVRSLFNNDSSYEMVCNETPVDSILNKPSSQLYFLDGNICVWTFPWNSNVMDKASIRNLIHHAFVDWGSFDSFRKQLFPWQILMKRMLDSSCSTSILASRWKFGLYQDVFISNYYYHQRICRFLNGIDGIILPICFSKGETPLKYGKPIIEECLKQQVPIFFVDICNKEHSYEISNRLWKAIRRSLIQRALKIQQQKYISARTQFFLWLYTWRYDSAYLQGYRQAWMLRLSSHDNT